jgi:small subunit ribosomal protein S1
MVAAPAAPVVAPAPKAPAPTAARPLQVDELQAAAQLGADEIAALMREYAPNRGAALPRQGERVRGHVSRVTGDTVFVDIGRKADAAMDRVELGDVVNVGDSVEAWVLATKHGELKLTRSMSGDGSLALLEEARDAKIPIEGKVTGTNTGGLEVLLSGGTRAFCPMSQVAAGGGSVVAEEWIGRTLSFNVLDVRGKEAVVSHRAIADEQARTLKASAMLEMQEGQVYEATVVSVRDFGAFVRLANGAEGLVHVSNLSHKRVQHPSEAVVVGQEVRVKVLKVDSERQRLDLGIRQTEEFGGSDAPRRRESRDNPEMRSGDPSFGSFGALLDAAKPRR